MLWCQASSFIVEEEWHCVKGKMKLKQYQSVAIEKEKHYSFWMEIACY